MIRNIIYYYQLRASMVVIEGPNDVFFWLNSINFYKNCDVY